MILFYLYLVRQAIIYVVFSVDLPGSIYLEMLLFRSLVANGKTIIKVLVCGEILLAVEGFQEVCNSG